MSTDFYRTAIDNYSFNRGAGRLMWAGITIAFPTKIADVINMSTYDAVTGWNDLGATKSGIQISINNTEETFDVDQILGDIYSAPNAWEVSVGSQLAETTLERMQIAWQGSDVTTDATPPSGSEKELGIGNPTAYIQRRLAVLFPRTYGGNDIKVRAFFFRKVNKMPQESNLSFNKTGEHQSIPVRFKALPDASIADVNSRFFIVRDQI